MRYTAPSIIATYAAVSVIQSAKSGPDLEVQEISFTGNAAYRSEE